MSAYQFQPFRTTWSVGLANHLNLRTLPQHANRILLTAGAYQGLFTIVVPAVSKRLFPETYNKLDERTRTNWCSRTVSFLQAIFISYRALSVILTDPSRRDTTTQQRLWSYSPALGNVQSFAAGYFAWDVWLSIKYYDFSGATALAHGICAFLVTMLGFRPFANYYGVNFVLYELSTPFLHIHWALDKLGKTGSNLQLYNGLALMASFFGCRLVWGSYQTYLLTNDIISAWQTGPVPRVLFSTYLVANTALTCLNFYWFSKMVDALRKRFQSKPPSA